MQLLSEKEVRGFLFPGNKRTSFSESSEESSEEAVKKVKKAVKKQ